MTGLLVDAGWASAEARSAALEHLLHGRRGEAVHEPYAALGGVAKRVFGFQSGEEAPAASPESDEVDVA